MCVSVSMWFQARLCNSSSWNNTLANHWHVNNPVILDLGRQSFYPRNPIVDTYAFTVWSPQGIEPTKKILRLSNIHQSSRAIVSVWPGIKLQFFVIFSNCSQRHLLTGILKKKKTISMFNLPWEILLIKCRRKKEAYPRVSIKVPDK